MASSQRPAPRPRRLHAESLEPRLMLSNAPALSLSLHMTEPGAAGEKGQAIAGVRSQKPKQHLPDLTVLASAKRSYLYGWYLDSNEPLLPGRTLLRMSNAVANQGKGALEVRGGSINPQGGQEVLQRIYTDDGPIDRLAGTFVYHPNHDHVHFEDFAQYNLRGVTPGNGVGDVVASGGKVSFCLLDSEKHGDGRGANRNAHYRHCDALMQGISAGWADVYHAGLPDQWIDITGVPDGEYWLESVVDPSDHIVESDETNNASRILIRLGPADPDDFSDLLETAEPIVLAGDGSASQAGRIERTADVDVFSFVATRKGKIRVTQSGLAGGIDSVLSAYDHRGERIDDDDDSGGGLNSRLRFRVVAGQTYFVQAAGFGTTVGQYTISIGMNR